MNRPSRLIISLLLPACCVSGADLREQAYQIRLQHLGPEHQSMLGTAHMIGWSYRNLGRHNDAIQLWTEQLEIVRREYGELHGKGLLFMMNIGRTYTYLGRYKEGEVWLAKTLELCESSSSEDVPYVRYKAREHLMERRSEHSETDGR